MLLLLLLILVDHHNQVTVLEHCRCLVQMLLLVQVSIGAKLVKLVVGIATGGCYGWRCLLLLLQAVLLDLVMLVLAECRQVLLLEVLLLNCGACLLLVAS